MNPARTTLMSRECDAVPMVSQVYYCLYLQLPQVSGLELRNLGDFVMTQKLGRVTSATGARSAFIGQHNSLIFAYVLAEFVRINLTRFNLELMWPI